MLTLLHRLLPPRPGNHDTIREYQRRYAEQAGWRFEDADSEHIVPAEQPGQVAAAIRRLADGLPA